MKLRLFLFLTVIFLSGCAVENHPDYQPADDAPTHDKLFENLFGVPNDAATPFEVFSNAEPHELLAGGLTILWMMAVTAFIVIILVNALKSTINAPHSNTLLGNDINTPIAPVRIGLTFLFLLVLPGGNHYSMMESIVLSANKYVSVNANNLYIENAKKARTSPSDLKAEMTSLAISKDTAYRVFTMAMCKHFLVDNGLQSKFSSTEIDAVKEYENGTPFSFAKGVRYTAKLSEHFWSRDQPIEGGCGQWYIYANPPGGIKIEDQGSEFVNYSHFNDNTPINNEISSHLSRMMNQLYFLTKASLFDKYYALAQEMIEYKKSGDEEEGKAAEFKDKYNDILVNYNQSMTNVARVHMRSILSSENLDQLNNDALDSGINNGWFFGGSLPFLFATSADRILVFERVKLNTSIPMPDAFVERYSDDLKEYLGYGASILDSFSSAHNSGLLPQDDIGAGFWGTYGECVFFDSKGSIFDCIGAAINIDTLGLVRALSANVSNPLTLVHQVGLSGAENVLETLIGFQVAHSVAAGSAGFAKWIPFLGGAAQGSIMSIADNTLSNVSPILNFLSITYILMAYLIILLPFIYYSVAVISYLIQLFVSVLGANFFAVSHAWLEGQGFVSSYAQRGYPSLMFSALTPILIVIVFFIYLFVQPFVFQFLGWTFGLFLNNFIGNEEPSLYGGMFFHITLLSLMIVLHRIVAKFILDIPDRVMKLIGVHEALGHNDFSGQVESMGKDGMSNTVSSTTGAVQTMGQGAAGQQDPKGGLQSDPNNTGQVDSEGNEVDTKDAGLKGQSPGAHNRGSSPEGENQNDFGDRGTASDVGSQNAFGQQQSSGEQTAGEGKATDQNGGGDNVATYQKVTPGQNATGMTAIGNTIAAKIATDKNRSDAVASLNSKPSSTPDNTSGGDNSKEIDDALERDKMMRESMDKDKLGMDDNHPRPQDMPNSDEGEQDRAPDAGQGSEPNGSPNDVDYNTNPVENPRGKDSSNPVENPRGDDGINPVEDPNNNSDGDG